MCCDELFCTALSSIKLYIPTDDDLEFPPFKVIVPLLNIAWNGKGAFSVIFAKIPTELEFFTSIRLFVSALLNTEPSVEEIPTLFILFLWL